MAKPRRGYRGQRIKLPPLAYERTSAKTRATFINGYGRQVQRPRLLVSELPTYVPPPQRMRTRRDPLQHVELLTSGHATPSNTEIPYTWRGRGNKAAHKVWAQIKDSLPTDAELKRWAKSHELLTSDTEWE